MIMAGRDPHHDPRCFRRPPLPVPGAHPAGRPRADTDTDTVEFGYRLVTANPPTGADQPDASSAMAGWRAAGQADLPHRTADHIDGNEE